MKLAKIVRISHTEKNISSFQKTYPMEERS